MKYFDLTIPHENIVISEHKYLLQPIYEYIAVVQTKKRFKINQKLLRHFSFQEKFNLWEFLCVQVTHIISIVSLLINYILKTKAVK